jgi:hypothetical protein
MTRGPEEVLKMAVMGMIKKNTLRHRHMEPRFRVFADSVIPSKYRVELEAEGILNLRDAGIGGLKPLGKVPRALNGNFEQNLGLGRDGTPKL